MDSAGQLPRRARELAGVGATTSGGSSGLLERMLPLAVRGLTASRLPDGSFAHTRQQAGRGAVHTVGSSVRYTAIAALGLGLLPETEQRASLGGSTAAEVARLAAERSLAGQDPGAVALALWAQAELGDGVMEQLVDHLVERLRQPGPLPTVDASWALTALTAAGVHGDVSSPAGAVVERLMAVQGSGGLFAHDLSPASLGRLRAHVGCFADQVYPVQALARHASATGDRTALEAADRCADRICRLQGDAGQWWWHFDVRTGEVVESYPVYSVHQHAMAPMALLDLRDAGGTDHGQSVARGLGWIEQHPETGHALVSDSDAVVWRKVGRREPAKAVRRLRAASTALRPGLRLGWLDRLAPPGVVDRECRPYELGWLLYAWLRDGARAADLGTARTSTVTRPPAG